MAHGPAPRPHLERGRAKLAQVAIGGVEQQREVRRHGRKRRRTRHFQAAPEPFNDAATVEGCGSSSRLSLSS